MKFFSSILFLVLFTFSSISNADEQVSPAPSGVEKAVIETNPKTGASVILPGKDSPVKETKEGNKTTLEFKDPTHNPNDTTIIYSDEKK